MKFELYRFKHLLG